MKTLVIDSATQACSVALFQGDALLAGDYRELGRGHAEHLIPMIANLPGKGKADRIVVSLGPGSFTGVRIGLAAARALGVAWGVPALGYPTLALVAAMARNGPNGTNQPVCAAMTGGHGEWFVQDFSARGLPQNEFASLAPAQAAQRSCANIIAGNQAEALVAAREYGQAVPLLPDARQFHLLPQELLRPALAPIYGRAPDARLPGGSK